MATALKRAARNRDVPDKTRWIHQNDPDTTLDSQQWNALVLRVPLCYKVQQRQQTACTGLYSAEAIIVPHRIIWSWYAILKLDFVFNPLIAILQVALLSQRGRAMLRISPSYSLLETGRTQLKTMQAITSKINNMCTVKTVGCSVDVFMQCSCYKVFIK